VSEGVSESAPRHRIARIGRSRFTDRLRFAAKPASAAGRGRPPRRSIVRADDEATAPAPGCRQRATVSSMSISIRSRLCCWCCRAGAGGGRGRLDHRARLHVEREALERNLRAQHGRVIDRGGARVSCSAPRSRARSRPRACSNRRRGPSTRSVALRAAGAPARLAGAWRWVELDFERCRGC